MLSENDSPNSKCQKEEKNSTKVVNTDFKKVSRLDITVLCSICQQAVHLSQILHHKKAHQAQANLGYQRPWVEPIDEKKIVTQRKRLIKRMLKTAIYTERKREKIGYSFELLRKNLRVTPCFYIDSVPQSTVYIKEVSTSLIKAIAICQDKNPVWRADLEDVFVVLDNYGSKVGTCFLGLFDGSNGISAAEITSAELPLLLLEQLSHDDPSYQVSQKEKKVLDSFRTIFRADYRAREKLFARKHIRDKSSKSTDYEWIHKAYAKSFWRMDRLLRLGRNEVSRVCWSSCSAVTCLVEEVRDDEENQSDPERLKTLEHMIDEKEPRIVQMADDMPQKVTSKENNATEHESILLNTKKTGSIAEQEEEPLGKGQDEKNNGNNIVGPEDNGQVANSNDEILKQNLSSKKEQLQRDPYEKTSNEEVRNTEQMANNYEENPPENTEQSLRETFGETAELRYTEEMANDKDAIQKENPLENSLKESLGETDEESGDTKELINDKDGIQEDNPSENMEHSLKQSLEETNEESRDTEEIIHDKDRIQGDNPPENIEENLKQSLGETDEELRDTKEIINNDEIQDENLPKNIEESLKEQLEIMNDVKEKGISEPGDNEQTENKEDKDKEEGTPEKSNSSAERNEISTGVMHIANIGNVHAVLCKNGKSYWLTKEHSTYCKQERIRVLQNGGYISSNEPKGLVERLRKNTRGLGHHGNPRLKHSVIPVPHTISFPVDDSCQFLILASNGLWEVLDKNEAVLLALTMFSAYLEKYQDAQLRRSRRTPSFKLTPSDVEQELYSLYENQDLFSEVDLYRHLNVNLKPTAKASGKPETFKSNFFAENTEDESESTIEEIDRLWFSSEDTNFKKSPISSPTITTHRSLRESLWSDTEIEESVFQSSEASQISEDLEMDSKSFYELAAKYISKKLVKAALKAGSRDNITVLVALLNGCDKIPKYI